MKSIFHHSIKAFLFSAATSLMIAASGHSAVVEGDAAIIRVNGSGSPDNFSVLVLNNLSAGDSLFFTDAGWLNGGGFLGSEGAGTTDILTSDVAAGTVLDISTSSLNASGEQMFLFTGTKASPTLVAGINWNNSGWITSGTVASDTSYEPNQGTGALTSGVDYLTLNISSSSSLRYNGTLTGTAAQLRTAISNPANWVASSTSDQSWTGGTFSVTAAPEPATFGIVLLGGAILTLRRRHLIC